MAWLPSWRAPRSRATFLVLLLTLMLALTAVLAYEAHQSAVSHRKVAQNVLRDYVEFASWELGLALRGAMGDLFSEGLKASERLLPADQVRVGPTRPIAARTGAAPAIPDAARPTRVSGTPAAAPEDCCARPLPLRTAFRLDPITGQIESRGLPLDEAMVRLLDERHLRLRGGGVGVTNVASTSSVVVSSLPCTMIARRWDASSAASGTAMTSAASTSSSASSPGVLGFTVGRRTRGAPREIYGFVLDRATLTRVLEGIVRDRPLLPPTLLPEHRGNSALAIRVLDESGDTLYESTRAEPSAFVAHGTVEQGEGRLRYQVALRPSVADRLVIGGLPRSRLGLLVGLLALTTGLTIVALVQLRREYELARLRSDFVSSVSHELRTPLAQIRMFSETLLLGRVRSDGEARRSLEIIQQESRRLGHLVENVLHVSKTQHRIATLAREPLALEPILREVVDAFAPLARARRVSVHLVAQHDVVAPIDASALRQILLNLLDNAVKYGPAGQTVTVALSLVGPSARITVDDEGPGVPVKDAARIWEPFARLRQASEAGVAGAGIGLAVVRELTQRHDGRVGVSAAPAGGARFSVELPGATAAETVERRNLAEARSISA